jgi:integrase
MARGPRITLDVGDWPRVDQDLWSSARRPGGPFDEPGLASGWRPKTKRQVEKDYGLWICHLRDRGELDLDAGPSSRVTKDRLGDFISRMEQMGWASTTITSRVRNLREALRVLDPASELGLITAVLRRLSRTQIPTRNKPARVVHPSRILERTLGFLDGLDDLPCDNETIRGSWYRDGLIVAILAVAPLRLQNLTDLDLDRHMDFIDGAWRLSFGAEETKQHRRFEVSLPPKLTPYFERYLEAHRPRLTRGKVSTRLWISIRGGPISTQAVYNNVCDLTKRLLGRPINPHLFRDCLATAMATDTPEHVHASARLLGHAGLETTESYYNQARQLTAQRRYHEALAALRESRREKPE